MSAVKHKPRGPRRAPRASGQAGVWDIPPWCEALGISRNGWYRLDPKPFTVRVGKLIKIVEHPSDYGKRIASLQEQQAA
jgi:hypothetical protein